MEIKLVKLAPDENRLSKASTNSHPLFCFSFQQFYDTDEHTGCMDMFLLS